MRGRSPSRAKHPIALPWRTLLASLAVVGLYRVDRGWPIDPVAAAETSSDRSALEVHGLHTVSAGEPTPSADWDDAESLFVPVAFDTAPTGPAMAPETTFPYEAEAAPFGDDGGRHPVVGSNFSDGLRIQFCPSVDVQKTGLDPRALPLPSRR